MRLAFLKKNNLNINTININTINEEKKKKIVTENINYNVITNILDYSFDNKLKINKINSIIISIAPSIERFISADFLLFIDKLVNQELKPKFIFVNIYDKIAIMLSKAPALFNKFMNQSNKINIDNQIKILNETYTNVIVNMCDDIGPIMKILGIKNQNNIMQNDKIIIIDSDIDISSKLTLYYELCYEIYNCEFIGINYNPEKKYDSIFFDNLNTMVSSSSSYSIKYKYIDKLYDFYIQSNNKDDDFIISSFYKNEGLYSCGINLNLSNKIHINLSNNLINCNINYKIENLEERYLLANIKNLSSKVKIENINLKHCSISYFNNNIAIITIISFQTICDNITLLSNNKIINIENLIYCEDSNKHTYFINIHSDLEIQQTNEFGFNLFQTYKNNLITRNKFYSISTLLNYIPYLNYVFFNDQEIINFIKFHYPVQILKCYNLLNVGSYKADFFRALYLYKLGGLYFNCKNILYDNIYNLLIQNIFFIKDSQNDSVHNGILYSKNKYNELYFNYIISIVLNIIKKNYTKSSEGITGSNLLFKLCKDIKDYVLYKFHNKLEILSEYIVIDKKILINCSYPNYHQEDNNETSHHSIIWAGEKVFNNIFDYDKINFIDHIVWINLDKSIKRRTHMSNLLENIKIPSTRISAIDGTKGNLRNTMTSLGIKTIYTSNPEIGCTLSHIKAISHLSTLEGEYFLVLEDDVTLDNLCLFDITLKDIIETCPKFDILQIHGITDDVIPYAKTLEAINLTKKDFKPYKTWSTAAYIISRNGIDSFIKKKANFNNNKLMIIDKNFDIADIYTYRNMMVYSYKYNFFSTQEYDSDIHNSHLDSHKKSLNHNLNRLVHDNIIIKIKNKSN